MVSGTDDEDWGWGSGPRDGWSDDYPDDRPECPACGRIVPASHLDTDSGNCITCEDEAEDSYE